MKYFPLNLGPMQESGSALLRVLQNESMIPLDLLIREAVQNSLDAALKSVGGEVSVDVTIRSHGTQEVVDLFESGIDKGVLSRVFPEGGRMLEIRDKGTEGLTGPIRLEDVRPDKPRGNLLKLVYEVGRTHSDETSGGSWGLGKTCYFRVGVGLVLYYSRMLLDNGFEERLVACLVENESDENRLQRESATGIAWWGGEKGVPLTDSERIATLLHSIDVQPFSGDDTGTAIIIPFLRHNLIPSLDEALSDDLDDSPQGEPLPWWFKDYASYVCVALQRWFCARIDNPMFRRGPALAVSVNGQQLQTVRMQPVFQVLQALYNRLEPAVSRIGEDYLDKCGVSADSVLNKPVDLSRVFSIGTRAGRIAAVRLTPEQLKMVAPENMPDPYRCIFSSHEHVHRDRPLVAFMRGPGMIVRWDNSNDPKGWGGNLLLPAGLGHLVGLFVPDNGRELKGDVCEKLRNPGLTLEAYLRSCERADHHQWVDRAGLTIISRIRGKAGNAIETFNAPVAAKPKGISLRAARNLADKLLPAGFGSDGRIPSAPPNRPDRDELLGRKSQAHQFPDLEVTHVRYGESEMHIYWLLHWGKGQTCRQIALGVDTESSVISHEKWAEEGLGAFPFAIENAMIVDEISLPGTDVLEIDGAQLIVSPWRSDIDGATVNGKLTIRMLGGLAGNLRPVLHAMVAIQTTEELA